MTKGSGTSAPKSGLQMFYCVLCRCKHVSIHKHMLRGKYYTLLRERFPKVVDRLRKPLEDRSSIYVCCDWFKDRHEAMGKDLGEYIVETEPQRSILANADSPRFVRARQRVTRGGPKLKPLVFKENKPKKKRTQKCKKFLSV